MIDRRDFIKTGIVLAGALLIPAISMTPVEGAEIEKFLEEKGFKRAREWDNDPTRDLVVQFDRKDRFVQVIHNKKGHGEYATHPHIPEMQWKAQVNGWLSKTWEWESCAIDEKHLCQSLNKFFVNQGR